MTREGEREREREEEKRYKVVAGFGMGERGLEEDGK